MNEAFRRRLVGLLTLAALALLLSWLLPRPGLRKLEGTEERVAAMDLTKPGSPAEEILPQTPQDKPVEAPKPKGTEGSTLFPLPADPNAPGLDAAAEEESAPGPDVAAPPPGPAGTPADKTVAESVAAERAAASNGADEPSAAQKAAADQAAAQRQAAQAAAVEKATAEKAAAERAAAAQAAAARVAAEKAAAEKAAAEKTAAEKTAAAKAAEKPPTPPAVTSAVPAPKPAAVTPPPTAAAPPPKPATPPAAAPPTPAAAGGSWYAQCGVYSMLANAQSLRDELARRGMACDMAPLETAKGTSYRVRCGPFKSRGEAEIVVSRIRDRVQAIVVNGGP